MRWLDDDPEAEGERAKYREAIKDQPHLEVADARPPEYSDEALALRFSEKHVDHARYVAAWGKWLLWTGAKWEFDQTLRAFDLARNICRIAAAEAPEDKRKFAASIASAKTVAAVISLARADRRHAAIVEQWDSDPWTLHTGDKQ